MANLRASPFVLTENTTSLTHSNGNGIANLEDTIVSYQVPRGIALMFGGARPGQKFFFMDTENAAGTDIAGEIRIYKLTPDGEGDRVLVGSYHTDVFGSANDKTQKPDVGAEPAVVFNEDEILHITYKPATALTYSSTESRFRLDLTRLTTSSL